MNRNLVKINTIALLSLLIASCSSETSESNNTSTVANNQGEATLNLVANGEDFVRQGFVTKDGWTMNFARLDVNQLKIGDWRL